MNRLPAIIDRLGLSIVALILLAGGVLGILLEISQGGLALLFLPVTAPVAGVGAGLLTLQITGAIRGWHRARRRARAERR